MSDYNEKPSLYKGVPVYVRLGGYIGDLPEFYSISGISWGQSCNECYVTSNDIFKYDGGICNHVRNEKERNALLTAIKTGSTIKKDFGYLAPQTNVKIYDLKYMI